MIRAAGILFVTTDRRALFLQRAPGGDYANTWCIPGGKLEDGETPEQAAVRETKEEAGRAPKGDRSLLARTIARQGPTDVPVPGAEISTVVVPAEHVDFTTFLQRIDEPFDVEIDEENVGFAWAPVDQPPEPLHPGCRVALQRLAADELGIARMMAEGALTSPQYHENVALFDIRITGTGTAYRKAHDEFVYRAPENYLTPDFLARCNGLPVLWEHPDKATLDSKEWADRVVGTTFLPYIKGDEVWGIVKIYDAGAIAEMEKGNLSTSPTVNFKDLSVNSKVMLQDGSVILIEGKPSLLDHIAICEKGVWDKGGDPVGVNSAKADSDMTEEEKKARDDAAAKVDAAAKADKAKADAEDSRWEKLMSVMDSVSRRMDAFEEEKKADKARRDSEEEMADKAKKDAAKKDGEEEEKKANEAANEPGAGDDKEVERKGEKMDAAKADKAKRDEDEEKERKARDDAAKADSAALARRIADVEAFVKAGSISDADHIALTTAQADADVVFSAFGQRAPRSLPGETLLGFRRRLANTLKQHSATWKDTDMTTLGDAKTFGIVEKVIYADAMATARSPMGLEDGSLREIHRRDQADRKIVEFAGRPSAWMSDFAQRPQRARFIHNRGA